MNVLAFTASAPTAGLRYWDLKGPAGLIRFETSDVLGARYASVYLHGAVAPGGGELEPCELCGTCWPDAMGGDHAQDLRTDWEAALYHDAVIRTQLERWYTENLAAWAENQDTGEDPTMLLAGLVPDLPIITAAAIATALNVAGYQIVKAGDVE